MFNESWQRPHNGILSGAYKSESENLMAVSGVAMVWSGYLVSGLFTVGFLCSYELVLMTGGDTPVTSRVLETLESALVSTSLIMWRIADRIVFV